MTALVWHTAIYFDYDPLKTLEYLGGSGHILGMGKAALGAAEGRQEVRSSFRAIKDEMDAETGSSGSQKADGTRHVSKLHIVILQLINWRYDTNVAKWRAQYY